ncbi:flagellar biosynthesis protein FlhB [Lysobacter sp. A3-1-A15]|uniref:flagellar biosynthesis protein FlhB n=1 Tax=Novilysobacter viscosus TaxID=3098602 RepID=UPI002ED884E5
MAEQEQEDRTEEPTEKRLREAREKGDVPRSRELANVAVLGVTTLAVMSLAANTGDAAQGWLRQALMVDPAMLGQSDRLIPHAGALLAGLMMPVLPIIGAALAACFIAPALMGGLRFSNKALQPDFKRLNPLSGLKRIYGKEGLAELLRSLLRVVLIIGVGGAVVWAAFDDMLAMPRMSLQSAVGTGLDTALTALLAMAGSLGLLAAIDVPWQRWQHRSKLKMTKQEIRDELKQTEGNPEIKARVRQVARQMSQRRMMEAVPTADVVVMNPTHYAVALKYDPANMRAPKVVAKGVDELALLIRAAAQRHRIAVLEAPPLARALYRTAQVDQEIPVKLYAAVAQVLSYVFQLRRWHPAHGPAPELASVGLGEAEADGRPDDDAGAPTR